MSDEHPEEDAPIIERPDAADEVDVVDVDADGEVIGDEPEAAALDESEPAESETADPEPEPADTEGPRMRARRERAERREAQQRAMAIEEARREAKRRARGDVADKKPADRTVKGLKTVIWGIVVAVASVALGLVLYFTPVMSARSIVVVGTGAVSRDEVVDAAKVKLGTPLLQIDTDAVADEWDQGPGGGPHDHAGNKA